MARRALRSIVVFLVVLACVVPCAASKDEKDKDYAKLGHEVVAVVKANFFDAERAAKWAEQYASYAAEITDAGTFVTRTNEVLGALETSHTHYYPRGTIAYWGLLDIFGRALGIERVEYDSIGADIDESGLVRRVLAGGGASAAGLLRGDRIVEVDGRPYDPVDTFAGRAGDSVTLGVQRGSGTPRREVEVIPHLVEPKDEWLLALEEGARLITRNDTSVAYVPLLWCVGHDVQDLMQELIAARFEDARALVLDMRDGWGGCNPDFLNYFNTVPPVLSLIDREGQRSSYDPQWRKPLVVLINGGSRSGKEVVAWALKRHGLATLVGQATAGFVVGGRPFLLSDRSLLYVAVADTLVDGERLEGVGVTPDVEVPDVLEQVAGADPQLERAIALAFELSQPK